MLLYFWCKYNNSNAASFIQWRKSMNRMIQYVEFFFKPGKKRHKYAGGSLKPGNGIAVRQEYPVRT
jgi:hypothetical protein